MVRLRAGEMQRPATKDATRTTAGHHLAVRDVVRIYTDDENHEVKALDGFSMAIDGAEVVGLVGPSGCGKSTLLRLVAGLDEAQGGELIYDGEPIRGPHYDRGLVFQNAVLYPWLTVYDNIAFGLRARHVYKGNESKVTDAIHLMGLDGFEKSYPHQISGGMAARAALARTFIQDPGLILLDEPLSALDAFTRMVIQDEIIRMHSQSDAIFLLVTHDIEEAVYLCDRVIVMSARPGRTVGEVTIDLPHPRDRMGADFVTKRREILELFSAPRGVSEIVSEEYEDVEAAIERLGGAAAAADDSGIHARDGRAGERR